MKKVYVVSFSFLIFCFILSLLYGFFGVSIPELTPGTVKAYRFCAGLYVFFDILPAVIATGVVVGWSIDFGRNPGGSRNRFSAAMFSRYRGVMIDCLICVLILTAALEIGVPVISKKMSYYAQLPVLKQEYLRIGNILYERGNPVLAHEYANLAAEIDSNDKTVLELQRKTELELYRNRRAVNPSVSAEKAPAAESGSDNVPYTVYSLLVTARRCYEEKDYFGAHYYAQTAISAASPKDINIAELKTISAAAWNHLSETGNAELSEEQLVFAKKYEGYKALIAGDTLHAYYIFKTLYNQSKKLSLDPDVIRYLDVAERRLDEQYFFIDETFNLQEFESANNVCFKIKKKDGSTNVFFMKGVTPIKNSVDLVQYLRGLSIFNIDADGKYKSGCYVPYAKMTAVPVSFLDESTKEAMAIDDKWGSIPYIMTCAVDRNKEGIMNGPAVKYGEAGSDEFNYLLLPIPYSDFELLSEASKGAGNMYIISLLEFVEKAAGYGYSEEVFGQAMLNRLLYPIFMLVFLMYLAGFAWNGRIMQHQIFKFKWIIVFPVFLSVFLFLYSIILNAFKMMNYGFLGVAGESYAFLLGFAVYTLLLIAVFIGFLGRKNNQLSSD